ncbi:avenin-3-like [Lolium perenne]|uniref:avenin-3-like n=1 Tax=Lolium perenne TaxID=4522 RepID=UPI0021F571BF|nr:gamma-gliadin B-like [Lolium perenne]
MKIFLILALLGVVATMANATVQLDPRGQDQPFPQPQQPFPQPQQQFPQPQQPFPQPQQPFPQPQQPFPQPQQPFPQPQQPFPQQPFPQPQQPFPQPQQPFPQPWVQQQQRLFQQIMQQQLNQCQEFLVQQCKPVAKVPFLSWIFQQSRCQVMQQRCCQQLAQIPKQLRSPAIHSIVNAIIVRQQQQQPFQPQPQHVGQGFIQPQQLAQFQAMRMYALQTLPAMCNVEVPLYYSTEPFGSIGGF